MSIHPVGLRQIGLKDGFEKGRRGHEFVVLRVSNCDVVYGLDMRCLTQLLNSSDEALGAWMQCVLRY